MPLAAGSAYIGVWINYKYGYVRGATLTLTTSNAAILTSGLVVLIGWTGIACWQLICFILHLIRSTSRAKDGFYHQQQLLLRSQSPPFFSVIRMFGLAVAWRLNTRGSFLRSLPIIVLGLINLVVFSAAGLFVSKITNLNSEVLARGKCGFLKGSITEGALFDGDPQKKLIGDVLYQAGYTSYREESVYARSCYGSLIESNAASCNIYNTPFIPSIRIDDVPCPFAEKACLDKAISFDSGFISSESLGINARKSDQIQVRKKMTCAPIAVENYTTGWTSEKDPLLPFVFDYLPPNDMYKYYSLGHGLMSDGIEPNFTFVFSNSSVQAQNHAYELETSTFNPGSKESSNFFPIADLDQKDADLTIMFLTNKALNTNPVEDTWFKATKVANTDINFYRADNTHAAVGCTEQYQFCNGEDKCSPLKGMEDVNVGAKAPDIGYNKLQIATWELLKTYITFMQLRMIVQFLRNELLLASQSTFGGLIISNGVQPDQWRTEMANLFNITLAGLQAHGILHAAPGNAEFKPGVKLHDFIIPETTPEHLKLCDNQKFRSAKFSSVSLFGLIFVIIVCCTIGGLNVIVPPLVKLFQGRWKGIGAVAKRAWIEDDVLQLQRIALETRGMGPWKGRASAVPVLDSYGAEFQAGGFDGGYIEEVPLQEAHVRHDGLVPSQPQWDTKGAPQYSQKPT